MKAIKTPQCLLVWVELFSFSFAVVVLCIQQMDQKLKGNVSQKMKKERD